MTQKAKHSGCGIPFILIGMVCMAIGTKVATKGASSLSWPVLVRGVPTDVKVLFGVGLFLVALGVFLLVLFRRYNLSLEAGWPVFHRRT